MEKDDPWISATPRNQSSRRALKRRLKRLKLQSSSTGTPEQKTLRVPMPGLPVLMPKPPIPMPGLPMPMPGPPAGLEEPKPLGMPMLGLPVRQQEPKPLGMPMLGLPVRPQEPKPLGMPMLGLPDRQNTGTNMLRSGKVDRQEKDKI